MTSLLLPDLSPHHVGLSVRNLEETIAFWSEMLGFELDFQIAIPPIKARVAFLERGGFRIEIFEIENSEPTPSERWRPNADLQKQGAKHVAFAVDDAQTALEALFARGVKIAGVLRGHGKPMAVEADPILQPDDPREPARAFFLLDPSNILVEIVRRSDFQD